MRRKRTFITLIVVMALGGLTWALLPPPPDPQLVKVQQLQEKLFNPNAKLSDDERRKSFGELREASEKLTPEQRDEMMRQMRENPPPFVKQMQKRVVDFFDLPEDQRVAALDEQIDDMEKMRKRFEKRFAEQAKANGNGAAGGDRPRGGGPPWGNRGNMDEKQRNERRKRMLDHSTPQQRAMFSEYFKQLEQRRKERGMPPMGRGPR